MSFNKNIMEKIKSPITGNDNTRVVRKFDVKTIIELYKSDFGIPVNRFFEHMDSVVLLECMDTKYKFYYPYTVFGDTRFYEALQKAGEGKFGADNYYAEWKWEYEEALKWIKKENSVLDIGCGAGAFIDRLHKESGNKVMGLEFNKNALVECKRRGLEVHPIPIQEFKKSGEKFDVITYFQVLEHIENPLEFIQSSIDALNPGGKLIIGVPNNNPYYLCFEVNATLNLPPHHAGLWNKEAFKNLTKYLPVQLINVASSEIPSIAHYIYYFSKGLHSRIFKRSHRVWWFFPCAVIFLPVSIPIVLYKKFTKQLIGRTIIAVFEKTN
jgi:SAM-dependent methyltransferase